MNPTGFRQGNKGTSLLFTQNEPRTYRVIKEIFSRVRALEGIELR